MTDRKPRPSALRARFLRVVAGLGLTFSAAAPAAVAQPDLFAALITGPQLVHVQATAVVTIIVVNVGDPFAGDWTAEILLSDDTAIDAADPVVGTLTTSVFGTHTVLVQVPNLPATAHVWALRVLPAPGETNVANNLIIGTQTQVYTTDLILSDPTPISVFARVNDPIPEPVPVNVQNAGTENSILVFTVEELNPVPWLSIEPPQSFAIAGDIGNDVQLVFDHTFLPPGEYMTTLRFRNFLLTGDEVELPVTLIVGDAAFEPGHRLQGQVAPVGDVDEIVFAGVPGELVKLRVQSSSGDLQPRISFVDPDGVVEKTITFKHSKKFIKKNYKLKSTGEYTLRIEGGNTTGYYHVKTGRSLPKAGRARTLTLKDGDGGGFEDVQALILPGATLEFVGDPNGQFGGPMSFGFVTPSGAAFDITGNSTDGPSGSVLVQGLELQEPGAYTIRVSGFGAGGKEKVKLWVLPSQPLRGKGKLYVQ